jgi:outer membrane protein
MAAKPASRAVMAALCAVLLGPLARPAAAADILANELVAKVLAAIEVQTEPAVAPLSLVGAVKAAVENNPGILARAYVPESASREILAASAAWDPALRAQSSWTESSTPVGSVSEASNTDTTRKQTLDQSTLIANVALEKTLSTGATWTLAWINDRTKNSAAFNLFSPQYRPSLDLAVRQPLLRDWMAIDARSTVLVAKADTASAQAAFEADLVDFVATTVGLYWDRVLAEARLAVARRSHELADELVREAQRGVSVGKLPPVAVKEALAEAAAREEEVLQAENTLLLADRTLERQVMLGGADGGRPARIIPTDTHQPAVVELDRRDSLRHAMERRPEVRSAAWALERAEIEERRARNQELPDLNFVVGYGLDGLAGDTKGGTKDAFDGDYGDALDELLSGDYYHYRIGLELEVPLTNARAHAAREQAEISVKRTRRELEQTLSSVSLDVDRALADTESAYKRIAAATLARELAEENLANQKRRFELGAVTTKDVLDFQTKLAQAEAAEVEAVTDHANAVTALARARGTLLERFGIELGETPEPELPIWLRF